MPVRPSEKEEEYFLRTEFERRKKTELEKFQVQNKQQKEKLKELHYMHCPKCGHNLIEMDYKGIEIDKCSNCDGVWLDAGELEQVSNLEKGRLDKLFFVFKK